MAVDWFGISFLVFIHTIKLVPSINESLLADSLSMRISMQSPLLCTTFVSLQFAQTSCTSHGGPDFLSESFEMVFFFLCLTIFDVWGDIIIKRIVDIIDLLFSMLTKTVSLKMYIKSYAHTDFQDQEISRSTISRFFKNRGNIINVYVMAYFAGLDTFSYTQVRAKRDTRRPAAT